MPSAQLTAAIKSEENSDLVLNIFGFICSLTFLIIYILFFHKLRQLETSRIASRRTKVVTNPWIMILPLMYTICYTVRYLLKFISLATDYKDVYLQITLDLGFIFGGVLFYVIMMLRLTLGFKGSVYELTRTKLILCCVILLCITLINIFHYLIKRHSVGNDTVLTGSSLASFHEWNANQIHNDLFIALVFCNLAFAAFLIYLFVRNIVLMVMAQMNCEDDQNDLSETHVKWLSIAIKYALLCGIAIASTNIQFSLSILINFGVFDHNPAGAIYFSLFNDWLWIIVMITNYLCILLTFPFKAKDAYDRICVSCHGCCQSIIKRVIYKPSSKDSIIVDDGDRAQLTVQMTEQE